MPSRRRQRLPRISLNKSAPRGRGDYEHMPRQISWPLGEERSHSFVACSRVNELRGHGSGPTSTVSRFSLSDRLTQSDLTKGDRTRVMVCITMDAHGRDVVQKMAREGVTMVRTTTRRRRPGLQKVVAFGRYATEDKRWLVFACPCLAGNIMAAHDSRLLAKATADNTILSQRARSSLPARSTL